MSGTIQLTANVTNNIYRTWDETDQIFNFFFPYLSLVIDRHRYVGYLLQSSEPLFKGSLQPPGSPSWHVLTGYYSFRIVRPHIHTATLDWMARLKIS